MTNYSGLHLELFEKGYVTIPVQENGIPLFSYKRRDYSFDEVASWVDNYTHASIALVCGRNNVVALDFDIDDLEMSDTMAKLVKRIDPLIQFRRVSGLVNNRFAIVCRASECLAKVSNANSAKYQYKGRTNMVEFFGNKLITVYGQHRKSNGYYYWDYELYNTMAPDLPVLTRSDVEEIFDVYASLAKEHEDYSPLRKNATWSHKRKERTSCDENTSLGLSSVELTKHYSTEEIDEMLSMVSGDTRDEWLRVGMALHAQYNGDVAGFRRWDEWSSKFKGYAGTDDCMVAWRSFHTDGGVTLATIDTEVKSRKNIGVTKEEPKSPLDYALENYVLIGSTSRVADLSKQPNEAMMTLAEMKQYKSNVSVPVKVKNKDKVEIRKQKLMNVWQNHEDRKSAYATDYIPGKGRLVGGSEVGMNENYYNTYVAPMVYEPHGDKDLLRYFLNHIDYMFSSDPEWVLNWLAQIVQEPEKRYRTILYSIAPHTGTGRGWLSKLIGRIYGQSNVKTIRTMATIVNPTAKNGYLDSSVMLIINETDAPGRARYEVNDQLKSMVSDDYQEVDLKYGKQSYNQKIYTRVFIQSNSIGNLVIDKNDNRIQPFINLSLPRSKAYYTRLHNLLENQEFINQVWWFLKNYKLDREKLQAAYMSQEKRTIIASNLSFTSSMFYEFMSVVGSRCFTRGMINAFIGKRMTMDDVGEINEKELKHLVKDNVVFNKKVFIDDVVTSVYSIRADDKMSWSSARLAQDVREAEKLITGHYEEKKDEE